MKIVILRGSLSRAASARDLPSGDRLAALEVTVREGERPAESVPVVLFDPPARILALDVGAEVVVAGRVRRRFFRTPMGTGSRTEVVASQVLPVSQRKRIQSVIDEAVAALSAPPG